MKIDRNLDLVFAYIAGQIEHPERLAEIPREPTEPAIVLLPDDDPELAAYNLQLGLRTVQEVREHDFLIDRRPRRDLYIPFDAVQAIANDRVVLNLGADQLDSMGWPGPPPAGQGGAGLQV